MRVRREANRQGPCSGPERECRSGSPHLRGVRAARHRGEHPARHGDTCGDRGEVDGMRHSRGHGEPDVHRKGRRGDRPLREVDRGREGRAKTARRLRAGDRRGKARTDSGRRVVPEVSGSPRRQGDGNGVRPDTEEPIRVDNVLRRVRRDDARNPLRLQGRKNLLLRMPNVTMRDEGHIHHGEMHPCAPPWLRGRGMRWHLGRHMRHMGEDFRFSPSLPRKPMRDHAPGPGTGP